MIRRLKGLALGLIAGSGVLQPLRNSKWRRQRLAILCYHGFAGSDECEWLPDYFVTIAHLQKRLAFLRDEGYQVLPLDESVSRLAAGRLPDRSVALTIDDGGADFYTRAASVFEEYRMPATLYLTSFHCERQTPIFRFCASYILWKGRAAAEPILPGLGAGHDLSSRESRYLVAGALHQEAQTRGLNQEARVLLLRELADSLGVDFEQVRQQRICSLITPAEGRDLVHRGFDIQLHTHRHRTPRDRKLFDREIEENRRFLMEELGMKKVDHFCYPSGDYVPEFLPWLQDLQVQSATTCENQLASPQSHPLLLPRIIDTLGISDDDFACRMAGVIGSQEQRRFTRAKAVG